MVPVAWPERYGYLFSSTVQYSYEFTVVEWQYFSGLCMFPLRYISLFGQLVVPSLVRIDYFIDTHSFFRTVILDLSCSTGALTMLSSSDVELRSSSAANRCSRKG
jgi:hypothetical protein